MYMYFDEIILSSWGIKEHSAALSFNEDSNWIKLVMIFK